MGQQLPLFPRARPPGLYWAIALVGLPTQAHVWGPREMRPGCWQPCLAGPFGEQQPDPPPDACPECLARWLQYA